MTRLNAANARHPFATRAQTTWTICDGTARDTTVNGFVTSSTGGPLTSASTNCATIHTAEAMTAATPILRHLGLRNEPVGVSNSTSAIEVLGTANNVWV